MAFASELWDSFEVVAKENARGQALSGKVKELLGALAKAESEYAKTLAKVVNDKAFAGAVAFGELQVLFDTVKAETLEAGAAHAALGDQLAALAAHTGDALKDRKKRSKVIVSAGEKMLSDLKAAEGKLAKSKERFEKQKRVEMKVRDDFQRARDSQNAALLAKLTKKVEKEARAAEKADQEYADAVVQAQQQQERVYQADMPRVLTDLEAIEAECVGGTRDTFARMADARLAHAPRLQSAAQKVAEAASAFAPQAYIQAFCESHRTGITERPRAAYVPFDGTGDAGASGVHDTSGAFGAPGAGAAGGGGGPPPGVPPGRQQQMAMGGGGPPGRPPMRQGGAPMVARRAPARGGGPGRNGPPGGMPSRGPPGGAPGGGAPGQAQCRALYVYTAGDENELSFQGGEVMSVLQKDESGWWQCANARGQVGLVPSNYVEALAPGAGAGGAPPAGGGGAPPGRAAPAARMAGGGMPLQTQPGYSSQPPPDDGPPFGGIGTGVGATDEPSAAAAAGGAAANGAPPPPEVVVGKRVRVLYPYQPQDDDEISLEEGEVIEVQDADEGGWFTGTNKHGKTGQLPGNFVEIIE